MLTQELVSSILMPLQPADVFLSALAAVIVCKQGPFDSIWNLSNRVCDRYLPPMPASENPAP
jgi:hypothetical protein